MSLAVYFIVFDNRAFQAGLLIAVFFFPKSSASQTPDQYGGQDGGASISRFLLNRVGPLVFAEGALIVAALATLHWLGVG